MGQEGIGELLFPELTEGKFRWGEICGTGRGWGVIGHSVVIVISVPEPI